MNNNGKPLLLTEEFSRPQRALREAIHAFLTPHLGQGHDSQHTGNIDELEPLAIQTVEMLVDEEIIASADDVAYKITETSSGRGNLSFYLNDNAEIDTNAGYRYASIVSTWKPEDNSDRKRKIAEGTEARINKIKKITEKNKAEQPEDAEMKRDSSVLTDAEKLIEIDEEETAQSLVTHQDIDFSPS